MNKDKDADNQMQDLNLMLGRGKAYLINGVKKAIKRLSLNQLEEGIELHKNTHPTFGYNFYKSEKHPEWKANTIKLLQMAFGDDLTEKDIMTMDAEDAEEAIQFFLRFRGTEQ